MVAKGLTFYISEKCAYIASILKGNVRDDVYLMAKSSKEAKKEADTYCEENNVRLIQVRKDHIWSTSYYAQITQDGKLVVHQVDHNVGQLRTEILHKDHDIFLNEGVRAKGKPLASRDRKKKIVEAVMTLLAKYGKTELSAIDDTKFLMGVYYEHMWKLTKRK